MEKKITYHIIYQWIDLWKKILKAQGPTKFDSIYKKFTSPPICFGRMKIGAFFVPPKHAFSPILSHIKKCINKWTTFLAKELVGGATYYI